MKRKLKLSDKTFKSDWMHRTRELKMLQELKDKPVDGMKPKAKLKHLKRESKLLQMLLMQTLL